MFTKPTTTPAIPAIPSIEEIREIMLDDEKFDAMIESLPPEGSSVIDALLSQFFDLCIRREKKRHEAEQCLVDHLKDPTGTSAAIALTHYYNLWETVLDLDSQIKCLGAFLDCQRQSIDRLEYLYTRLKQANRQARDLHLSIRTDGDEDGSKTKQFLHLVSVIQITESIVRDCEDRIADRDRFLRQHRGFVEV